MHMKFETLGDWKRTAYVSQITPEMDGRVVIVMGWVRAIRKVGKLTFIQLSDRSGDLQILLSPELVDPEVIKKFEILQRESTIAVKGTVRANKTAPRGFEIIPIEMKILTIADTPLPLEVVEKKTPAELPTRLNARCIDLRKANVAAIFKIKAKLLSKIREFLEDEGFIEIHTPKIMGEKSEGGADVFQVKYFDRDAYLSQSPQFYKQMMMSACFDRVYEIGPAFRAEPSKTTRHVAEILMLDIEMSFINSVEDVMETIERMFVYALERVKDSCPHELAILKKDIAVPSRPFPRITVVEAKKILANYGLKYKEDEEIDHAGEAALGKYVKEKYKSDVFFLTDFPWAEAKFYHMQNEKNPKVANRCDLIYKGVEIATIAQREHRYDILVKQAKERGVSLDKIKFYLDAFKYGMPPHGGAGIGIDRIVQLMLDLPTVQEAILFPRTIERLVP